MLFARRRKPSRRERLAAALWPRRSFRRSFRYFQKRLLRIKASPHAVGAGFAAGVFSSFTPFLGFHILLAFALALLVRGNMAAAALGTLVGNPLTFPLIWGSTYELGHWLLHAETVEAAAPESLGQAIVGFDFAAVWRPLIEPMLVGSVPLGLLAAAVGYVALFATARSFRERHVLPRPGAGRRSPAEAAGEERIP